MAKTLVYREPDGDRAPFLRGILTQSLVTAGLVFEDAYKLAQDVRNKLKDQEEISTHDIKSMVAELLRQEYDSEQVIRYSQKFDENEIIVHMPTHSEAFSLNILAHTLSSYAIDDEVAIHGAKRVYRTLEKLGYREIDHKALRRIVYECLQEHTSEEVANRYLSWRRFENSGVPLILVIGGVTGTGKSTLSTELAYKLNIARAQSTDMLREIIRTYLATPVAPTLQYSTFEAWKGLPSPDMGNGSEFDNPVITGFLSQLVTLKPALQATIRRAVTEGEHLIVEGVHALCTELNVDEFKQDALVVPLMIGTLDKQSLKNRFIRRGKEQNMRKSSRYIDNIDDIWALQSYLLDVADHAGITIINNTKLKSSISEILELISAKILKRFPPDTGFLQHGE